MIGSAWLRTLLPRKVKSPVRRGRLVIESLEDRCLLAFGTLTSLSDSAFGFSTYGQTVTFTASVSSGGFAVPEGAVTFSSNGVALLNPVPVNSSGQASFYTSLFFAGFHTITATYTDSLGNFASSSGSDYLSVSPAPLTITAQSQIIVYGQPVPTVNVPTYSGFVNGDTSASLTTPPSFNTDAATYGNAVGTYPIVGSGAYDPNYSISYVNGTLTIMPPNGVVSGTDFRDYNCNGIQDPGEPGIPGLTIFVDLDNSRTFKSGDPMAITDANGHFQITGVPNGTYTIFQITYGGVLITKAAGISAPQGQVTLTTTQGSVICNGPDVYTSIAVPLTLPPTTPFQSQGSPNADYVEGLYRAILDRDADPSGLANWTNLLNSGAATRLQVVKGIRNSVENFTREVTAFYQTLLGRAPDPAGLQSWVQQLEAGMREEQIAFYFLDSPEYLSQGDKHFVDQMYISLLGRNFDSAGEATWLNQLGAGTLTHEQVITDFLYSTESLQRLTEGYYEVFLQRQADPAGLNGWVANLQQGTPFLTTGQLFLSSDEFYTRAAAQG